MIVQRRLLDPVLLQTAHHRRHLTLEEYQVSHHHHVIANPLERDPRPKSESRLQNHAIQDNAQVTARKAELEDTPRIDCPPPAECVLDCLPIPRRLRGGGSTLSRQAAGDCRDEDTAQENASRESCCEV